jgi:hypothetical protein
MPGHVATDRLGSEDAAKKLIALLQLRRLSPDDIPSQISATQRMHMGVQTRRMISHPAKDGRQQRFGSAMRLFRRNP